MEPVNALLKFIDHGPEGGSFLSTEQEEKSFSTPEGKPGGAMNPTGEQQNEVELAETMEGSLPNIFNLSNITFNSNSSQEDLGSEQDSFYTWREQEKIECYIQILNDPPLNGNFCTRVWDQLLCWPPTLAGSVASLPCNSIPEFRDNGSATRICNVDGTWDGNSTNEVPGWTNYSACIVQLPPPDLIFEWLPLIKKMSLVGYSVSLVTLLISFVILISLKRLRCPRNILHLHLFSSFILRAVVVLIKSSARLDDDLPPNLPHLQMDMETYSTSGTWSCQLLITIWQYFILANYSWILMEGLYLHNLIFLALFSDSSAITMYIILGWGLPLVCVSFWAILKVSFDNVHCWTVNKIQWIFWLCIRSPVAVSNLLNFFFFLNVTRVLLLKLRSSINPESMKYRKLGKSTLVLVPLFGVHYFLLWGLSISTNERVELAWLLLDQVFASFQGFFVAVLYCLMNGEVRQELRKFFNRFKGEGLPELSYSTVVTNTRSYFSRGRTSIHSIHSTTKGDRQTPSPQMPRTGHDGLSPSPRALTPTSGKTTDHYAINSLHHTSQEALNNKPSSDERNNMAKESIELQPTSLMASSPNAASSSMTPSRRSPNASFNWEEAMPLIPDKESLKAEIQQMSKSAPEGEESQRLLKEDQRLEGPSNVPSSSENFNLGDKEERKNLEHNGMVGHGKDLLVKVNVHHTLSSSAQCSLIDNEAQQGESML